MSVPSDRESRPTPLHASVNLRDLTVLIADPGSYTRRMIYSMLRGFGASRILEVPDTAGVLAALSYQKIDILICDAKLPPDGGLALTQIIRRNATDENRTIPILIMSGDPQQTSVKKARDAGANMVVAKPMSPATLYDRLVWIAFDRRPFVDAPNYFGPDRRFKSEPYPAAMERRASNRKASEGAAASAAPDKDPRAS